LASPLLEFVVAKDDWMAAWAMPKGKKVTDTEADLIADRAAKFVAHFPTVNEALGCLDCDYIFRHGSSCPFCGSRAIWNVADLIKGN
jgi:hypothetical protein